MSDPKQHQTLASNNDDDMKFVTEKDKQGPQKHQKVSCYMNNTAKVSI